MRRFAQLVVLGALSCACGARPAAVALQPIGDFKQPISVTSDPAQRRTPPCRRARRHGRGSRSAARDPNRRFRPLVSCCESERGLLSIAPAPDFDSTGRFYAAYTGTPAAGARRRRSRRFVPPEPERRHADPRTDPHRRPRRRRQPQRRPAPVRARRLPLHLASATAAAAAIRSKTARTPKSCSARSFASTPTRARSSPTRSPRATHSPAGRPRRDLGLRPAQSLALLLRPRSPATW